MLPITLTWGNQRHQIEALVDSGAAGNFMDLDLAERLKIPSEPLPTPLVVTALDGRPLGSGTVIHSNPLSISPSAPRRVVSSHDTDTRVPGHP
ncbi:MAG: retropepsin-like aspartic protease [Aeromonas sp.]